MSATTTRPVLLQDVAQALANYREQHSATHIARKLGVAVSTITRRRDDLTDWSAGELLTLSDDSGKLRDSVLAFLKAERVGKSEAVAAQGQVIESMGVHSEIAALEAKILRDGIDERDIADFHELKRRMSASHDSDDQMMASLSAKIFARRQA